jgi:hypothetical protein
MMGVWLDRRIGGLPCWRLCEREELMRVPDELRGCSCFITTLRNEQPTGLGTAFFLGVEVGFQNEIVIYAVTAQHCLYDKDGIPDLIPLRLNTRAGGSDYIKTNFSEWAKHPSADVAVLRLIPDRSRFEYRVYAAVSAANQKFRKAREIGPGDEVFVTGLLIYHPGQNRIMPIVRTGGIAAFPDEPVRLTIGEYPGAKQIEDVVALIETRSIGGLSGSPVYLHLPFWRDSEKGDTWFGSGAKAASGGENWLLGLMHGFYPVGQNDPERISRGNKDLNTGIAVVTFVDRILDLIDSPEEVSYRDSVKRLRELGQMPIPTTATDETGTEFDEFKDLTRKLVHTPKHKPRPRKGPG